MRGPAERGERRVDERRERERRRDDAERRQPGEVPREDDRADRVADGDERDLDERDDVHVAQVEADDRGDAAEAHEEADPTPPAQPLPFAGRRDDQCAHERHGGDQQSRQ